MPSSNKERIEVRGTKNRALFGGGIVSECKVLIRLFIYSAIFSQVLCGCFAWKFIKKITKREKAVLPKMLILPFTCENVKIEEKITKGFIENLNKKMEVLDSQNFGLYLTSYPVQMEDYFTITETLDSSGTVVLSTVLQSSQSLQRLGRDLFRREDVRTKFYRESGIDYLVTGKAKEKKFGELELMNLANLETAETSEMKLLEIKTGETLLNERFKQGGFEIVAPERIGSKFASKVNKKLKQIQKETKKKEKALRKKLQK